MRWSFGGGFWGRYVLGYHGCDARLARAIASGRSDLQASENDYDWLGHGMYFWEDSPRRALQWARSKTAKRRHRVRNPAVLGAVLDLGNCLNLIDVEYLDVVHTAYQRPVAVVRETGRELPKNTGREFGARKLDCAVFEALHQFRAEERLEPFDTVRAFFVEGEPLYPDAGVRRLDHLQICVRNSERILGYFLPRGRGASPGDR